MRLEDLRLLALETHPTFLTPRMALVTSSPRAHHVVHVCVVRVVWVRQTRARHGVLELEGVLLSLSVGEHVAGMVRIELSWVAAVEQGGVVSDSWMYMTRQARGLRNGPEASLEFVLR
jgi:hypothetical protein